MEIACLEGVQSEITCAMIYRGTEFNCIAHTESVYNFRKTGLAQRVLRFAYRFLFQINSFPSQPRMLSGVTAGNPSSSFFQSLRYRHQLPITVFSLLLPFPPVFPGAHDLAIEA